MYAQEIFLCSKISLVRNEKIFLRKIYEVTPNHDLHQLTRHDLAKDQLKECVEFGID